MSSKTLLKIFSVRNQMYHDDVYKVITILGIKFKFKNKRKRRFKELESEINDLRNKEKVYVTKDEIIYNLYQDILQIKYAEKNYNINKYLKKITRSPKYLPVDKNHNYLNVLLGCQEWSFDKDFNDDDDVLITWELFKNAEMNIIKHAIITNKKLIFAGDSFLRSINTYADERALQKYQKGISFTFDDLTTYFDSTRMSRLEQMLNDKSLIITDKQKQRAKKCIDRITELHLTKYNYQPIYKPQIGRNSLKILVVDQSYGDNSILKGSANDKTFENMLHNAIEENPDADIIVKTHPDAMSGNRGGVLY